MAAAAGDKLDRALAKDQIYQAEAAADELEALAAKDPAGRAELGKRAAKIASLRSSVKELNGLLQELRSNDGWEFATEVKKKEITVHFKMPKGSPFVLTKARKVIRPVPGKPLTYTFVALCSLFAETDLMKHYFPMNLMESHDTLLEESAFSRFTRMRISVPVPFVNSREALIHGRGYDMTERSAMCISFKSLPDDFTHPGFTVPPCGKGYTRIDVSGAYYLEIQPDGSVVFLQLQMMDIKMKMLPSFILNMLSKGQMPVDFNDNLAAKLATWDNDSMWKQRTIANPAMYDDIRGRLEEYLAKSNVKMDASAPAARGPEAEPEAEASAKPVEPAEDSWEATLRNVLAYVLEEQQAKEYAKTVADYASVMGNKVYGEDPATSSSAPQDQRASKRASLRASKRLSKRLSKAFQAPNPADEAPPAILKQPTPRREPLEASSKPAKPQPALEKQPSRMQRIKSSVFGRSKSSKGAGPAGNQQLAAAR